MPWKKDLAKLKQDLGKEETPPAKATPPPKARPLHPVSSSMEEEDDIFLNAMGMRPKASGRASTAAPKSAQPIEQPAPDTVPGDAQAPVRAPERAPERAPVTSKAEFSSAMGDLKGLKPMKPAGIPEPAARRAEAPEPAAPAAPSSPAAAPAPEPAPPEPAPAPQASAQPAQQPVQIQLAAGMAIVVDGSLDLKGHARSDAEERLKERLLDGYALGWRTLHVVVGPSADLRQTVLDLLQSPAGRCIARYAQAPVPMGGPQAWILYFRGPGTP